MSIALLKGVEPTQIKQLESISLFYSDKQIFIIIITQYLLYIIIPIIIIHNSKIFSILLKYEIGIVGYMTLLVNAELIKTLINKICRFLIKIEVFISMQLSRSFVQCRIQNHQHNFHKLSPYTWCKLVNIVALILCTRSVWWRGMFYSYRIRVLIT